MQSVNKPAIFIATLGEQPQVVTLGLDALLPIFEVTIRYLSPQNTQKDRIHNALRKLDAVFENGRCAFVTCLSFLHAVQDEVNANTVWMKDNGR